MKQVKYTRLWELTDGRPHSRGGEGWRGSADAKPSNHRLLLLASFSSFFSCSSFTSFSTSHASSSSSSVWGVWSHSQKCLKLPSSSSGAAQFSVSACFGLSLPKLLRRWGGSFGGGGRGGTLVEGLAGLAVWGAGQRLMVPPPPLSSSLCDWPSSCLCCWGADEQMDLGWGRKWRQKSTLVYKIIEKKRKKKRNSLSAADEWLQLFVPWEEVEAGPLASWWCWIYCGMRREGLRPSFMKNKLGSCSTTERLWLL